MVIILESKKFSQSSLSASSTTDSTDLTVEGDNLFDNIDAKKFFVATDNPKGVKYKDIKRTRSYGLLKQRSK